MYIYYVHIFQKAFASRRDNCASVYLPRNSPDTLGTQILQRLRFVAQLSRKALRYNFQVKYHNKKNDYVYLLVRATPKISMQKTNTVPSPPALVTIDKIQGEVQF